MIYIIALISVVLVLIVLIQNPMGGGLSSGFSSANQIGGVRRTSDFLEKATWSLAILLMVLSIATVIMDSGTAPNPQETATGTNSTGDPLDQPSDQDDPIVPE